jgi:iron complex outermembrane receptor protein
MACCAHGLSEATLQLSQNGRVSFALDIPTQLDISWRAVGAPHGRRKEPSAMCHRTRLPLAALAALLSAAAVAATTNTVPAAGVSTALQVTVTARKWVEPLQAVPAAVTVQTGDELQQAGVADLREAARTVPNLTLGEFTARRLTFPYVRGIGSGQNDPAVTTCIDGVPQLWYVTANQELAGIDRIEYLRGPQGALYGSDTLGGAIGIVPRLPASTPGGAVTLSVGNYGYYDGRFTVEGPLGSDHVLAGAAGGYSRREGFTQNDVTGNDLDRREAWFGRVQLYLPDQGRWDFRLAVNTERDRDGDYALYDLSSIRRRAFHVQHDYEGANERDLVQPVFTARRHGDDVEFTSITALQWWQTDDRTDLDASPYDFQRKETRERAAGWTEELRLASPADAPVKLGDHVALHWLAGLFASDSSYRQRGVTDVRPDYVNYLNYLHMLDPMWYPLVPFQQHADADLDDRGLSLFGQTTFVFDEDWELGLGVREDFQHRTADLRSHTTLPWPGTSSQQSRDFSQVSPRISLGYHLTRDVLAYAQVARGYRAGGFNAVAPAGNESYDEETSWNYEAGLKSTWWHDRLTANLAVFRTQWQKLQVNSHVPGGDASQYYVENGGRATSQGAELELRATPVQGLELFGGAGLVHAVYRHGSDSAGASVDGHELPFAPRATWHGGAQYTQELTGQLQAFVRVEANGMSRYYYDPSNLESQGSYTLASLRVGVAAGTWRVEGWVKNLFDREYVPLAIPYGQDAFGNPFYVGECGAPRTVGVSLTKTF